MAARKQMLIRSEVKTVFADRVKIYKELIGKAKAKKDNKTIVTLRGQLTVLQSVLEDLNDLEVIK